MRVEELYKELGNLIDDGKGNYEILIKDVEEPILEDLQNIMHAELISTTNGIQFL